MYQAIKKTTLSFSRDNWQNAVILACLLASSYLVLSSCYIYAKAKLAQHLIANAWHQTLQTGKHSKPWSWADTFPVAKLSITDKRYYVLAGATGRTLAFGPGHMSSTPLPGHLGNTVITGHRDTHFSVLQDLSLQDEIAIETQTGKYHYSVYSIDVVHQQDLSVIENNGFDELTLITCYPFNAINPNTPWRYVIKAKSFTP